MSIEKLTFIFSILNSTLLCLFFLYLKLGIEKRLKKYEYILGDVSELNNKMHDRLVETRELVSCFKRIPKTTIRRLRMNASRLKKYDKSIPDDVERLIQTWEGAFFSDESDAINIDISSEKQKEAYTLIEIITSKVDKLVS